MPELPEVQTIVSQLEAKIVGKTIKSVWSDWAKAVRPSLATFVKKVVGAKISGVRRIGKHIVIDLSHDHSIVIHLKMTGHLLVKTKKNRESDAFKDPYNQFIHHRITCADKTTLEFSDMRKFGWMEVMKTREVEKLSSIAALGVDALSPRFTSKTFDEILEKRGKMKIGVLLLNQSLIAGIGNIYRSEALFVAGVLPQRLVAGLSPEERRRVFKAIGFVLRRAIRFRGTSDGDFRDTDGLPGGFKRRLGVYGQEGKPCPKCGTIVERLKLGQRSVFFCPVCQR